MADTIPPDFTYEDDIDKVEEPSKLQQLPCFRKPKTAEEKEKERLENERAAKGSLLRVLFMLPSSRPIIAVGIICSLLNGGMLPAFSLLFGQLFNAFFKTPDEIRESVVSIALFFLLLGLLAFCFTYLSNLCFMSSAERTMRRLRRDFFTAILSQEVAWMDATSSGALASRISGDMTLIQNGIAEKVGQYIFNIAQFITGIVVSFVYGWKMTLVLLSLSPAMVISGALQAMFLKQGSTESQNRFAAASRLVEETISGYRTVLSFVMGPEFVKRFESQLLQIDKINVKMAHITGFGVGFAFFVIFCIYALGFWYAGQLVASGEMQAGDALTVFFAVVIGALGLGQASQIAPDFDKARGALVTVFDIMDRKSAMDMNAGGPRLEPMKGAVTLENVAFTYPTRKEAPVFKDLSMEIRAGSTTAVVGPSGSGKSTIIQLIERFYDPDQGRLLIDGVDLKTLDLEWLRSQIAIVSQEPILFSCSIADNIRYGKHDATQEEVIEAAKLANAHNFIQTFPEGYDTLVGERGAQLSGGQKQRVAIARAVLKNPKLLLLDEATSALDAESEVLVQDALNKLMKNRTSIVVAHRLSTIRQADNIIVLVRGKVVETGDHEHLLAKHGVYYGLVARQLDEHGGAEMLSEDQKGKAVALARGGKSQKSVALIEPVEKDKKPEAEEKKEDKKEEKKEEPKKEDKKEAKEDDKKHKEKKEKKHKKEKKEADK